ncbi:ABC transporter substrate-binding protein [Amycolatopsis jiangsuensis]|uniref:Iron complex transport system substrate-binding protein n=1 Tax=Amycolatopsis jiangsuensis TaxID=1181879 RepID=A0A840ILW1_9PSEU|nr:iron-siderophore ABC transporter substrate-binding protein [Amycolatopsis jiangsuensis]MBB4683341.1 iron complex transport system substrate-binding protein [Amycolatopsis jiangsuensis]
MKKKPALLGALSAAVLLLSACSSGSDTPESGGSPNTASNSSAYPVTVPTKFGDVTVEKKPERVVALGWGDAETALELGVQPVGASDWLQFGGTGVGPWDAGKYQNPPEIIQTQDPSYEKIAALRPDLILDVRGSGDQRRHDLLAKIAPTVGIPAGAENYLTSTEQETTTIAAALGVKKQGEELLAQVDKAFSAAAEAHPGWKGKSVTVATRTSEGWGAYTEGDVRLGFLQKLGFQQSPAIAKLKPNSGGFSASISGEQLGLLDADLLVAFPIFIDRKQIADEPQWKLIPAVKDGRSVVIDGELSNAFSAGTPGAQRYALEKLVPLMEKTGLK